MGSNDALPWREFFWEVRINMAVRFSFYMAEVNNPIIYQIDTEGLLWDKIKSGMMPSPGGRDTLVLDGNFIIDLRRCECVMRQEINYKYIGETIRKLTI